MARPENILKDAMEAADASPLGAFLGKALAVRLKYHPEGGTQTMQKLLASMAGHKGDPNFDMCRNGFIEFVDNLESAGVLDDVSKH